jgi:hypothetical protein
MVFTAEAWFDKRTTLRKIEGQSTQNLFLRSAKISPSPLFQRGVEVVMEKILPLQKGGIQVRFQQLPYVALVKRTLVPGH